MFNKFKPYKMEIWVALIYTDIRALKYPIGEIYFKYDFLKRKVLIKNKYEKMFQ